ncbi:hypothetical protein IRB23SM22_03020 [Alkalibacterium sp. s-m-22]|uniref:Transposase n=1 Tax=Alkalibacterium indicireducens TaxID=398758 RepID=A0ABN1ANZ0_9LACT
MSYTHLTMEEFGWIETYLTLDLYAPQIADKLGRTKTRNKNSLFTLLNIS